MINDNTFVYYVFKYMRTHKATVVITGQENSFHNCIYMHTYVYEILKLVSAIFHRIFVFFSRNDSPFKTIKNISYFIEKAFFVLEILKFS